MWMGRLAPGPAEMLRIEDRRELPEQAALRRQWLSACWMTVRQPVPLGPAETARVGFARLQRGPGARQAPGES